MDLDEKVNELLNGASVRDTLKDILSEVRRCRYVGGPVRRKIRGKIVPFRKRVCMGKPNPSKSRAAKQSARKHKASRKRAAKVRWKRWKPK